MADPVEAHCPHCNGDRTCEVHGTVYKSWSFEDRHGNSAEGGADHSLLECRGCGTVFYENSSWCSENADPWYDQEGGVRWEYPKEKLTYPKPDSKTKPVWLDALYTVDDQLHSILQEMYVAHDNQSFILTVIGLRTALDRCTEVLGIDPAKIFAEKLTALHDGGWIGETEKDILGVVTDAGNAAAHRGWSPNAEEVAIFLSAMELFLQKAFIVGKNALGVKARIPTKPARKKTQPSAPSVAPKNEDRR